MNPRTTRLRKQRRAALRLVREAHERALAQGRRLERSRVRFHRSELVAFGPDSALGQLPVGEPFTVRWTFDRESAALYLHLSEVTAREAVPWSVRYFISQDMLVEVEVRHVAPGGAMVVVSPACPLGLVWPKSAVRCRSELPNLPFTWLRVGDVLELVLTSHAPTQVLATLDGTEILSSEIPSRRSQKRLRQGYPSWVFSPASGKIRDALLAATGLA